MQDEHGLKYGFDNDMDSINDLNKVKQDLLVGKREYDSIRFDLKDVNDAFLELCDGFPEQRSDTKLRFGKLNMGYEISRIVLVVNALGNVYADAFGLASNIITELEEIVNESEPNKKWDNLDHYNKNELLTFAKEGLIACTNLLGLCNDLKQTLSHDLNDIRFATYNKDIEELIVNWINQKSVRSVNMKQIKLAIEKLSGKRIVKQIFEDGHAVCRYEFNRYFNGYFIDEWKNRAYQNEGKFHLMNVSKIAIT